jgi:6-phosphogluconolactonase
MVHQSGKFVYGSNRGHNSIVGFRINQSSGKLHPPGAVTNTPVPVSFAFGRVIS